MRNENVYLIQTREKETIINPSTIDKTDITITNLEIMSLINEEMDETNRLDTREDFESDEAFLLHNITQDSYISYLQEKWDDKALTEMSACMIQGRVIELIKDLVDASKNI